MSLVGFDHRAAGAVLAAQADPPRAQHRAQPVHRRHAHHRDHAGDLQGMRIVKAFTLEDEMRRRLDASVARSSTKPTRWRASPTAPSPLMETLGGFAIALAMIYGGYRVIDDRRDARASSSPSWPRSCCLRAGQAAGAAQHRSQQRSRRRAHPVRDPRQPAERAGRRRPAAARARRRRASNSPMCSSPIGRRAGAARHVASSPSPARSPRWSDHRAAASRRCST